MAFDQAVIVALLGVNFYILYLSQTIERQHQTLKIALMLTSFFSVFVTLGFAVEVVSADATANAAMLSIIQIGYQTYIWLMMGFIAYWFLYVFGSIARNLWLKRKNRLKRNKNNYE